MALASGMTIRSMNTTQVHALLNGATAGFIRPLLRWYQLHARDLPWRQTKDPYAVWVSEVMLQQTQVKTVIPYWQRWMEALPTVQHLADASEDEVLKLWEGLGYYTRARNLRRAAQFIVQRHQGRFPRSAGSMRQLPGIGSYTSGAIRSIAFNQPSPVLDGNVRRVLCRVFMMAGQSASAQHRRELEQLTRALIRLAGQSPASRSTVYGDWNQALMELGATVCAPRRPQCPSCPVVQFCEANLHHMVHGFPWPSTARAISRRLRWVFVVEHQNRCLVARQSKGAVNAGLWEFPSALLEEEKLNEDSVVTSTLGFTPAWVEPVMGFSQTITNCRYQVRVFRGEVVNAPPQPGPQERWLTAPAFRRLPFSAAHRKIVERLFP
jgi:A/G-specific adenine glycosylase